MRDADVDALVRSVWAAATGEETWLSAMQGVANHFGTRLAVIQRFDLTDQRLLAQESGGVVDLEGGVLQYVRRYRLQDPRRAQVVARHVVPHGHWYHDHEYLDDRFVAADPFYQHFLSAYGGRYVAARTMAPAPDQAVLFALELSPARGPLGADERGEVDRLGLHLEDALRAYERLRRAQAQVLAGHQLLHSFAQPMWLVDTDRFVHDANAAARAELQRGRLLVQRGAHLLGATSRLDKALLAAMHQLRSQPHGSRQVLQQRLPGEAQPLWLHLSLVSAPKAAANARRRPPEGEESTRERPSVDS